MYVALMDYDMLRPGKKYPNLELMKLATYHKQNKDIVKYLTDARQWEQFSKIYVRKDRVNNDFPNLLMSKPNCEYGGMAFTNGIYVPMAQEIENCVPDKTIYNHLGEKIKGEEGFRKVMGSTIVRLQTLQSVSDIPDNERICIYDKNPLDYPIFEEVYNYAKRIDFRYPVYFTDLDKALEFCKREKIVTAARIKYIGAWPSFSKLFEKKNEELQLPLILVYKPYSIKISRQLAIELVHSQLKNFISLANQYKKVYDIEFDLGEYEFNKMLVSVIHGYEPKIGEMKKEFDILNKIRPSFFPEIKGTIGVIKEYDPNRNKRKN